MISSVSKFLIICLAGISGVIPASLTTNEKTSNINNNHIMEEATSEYGILDKGAVKIEIANLNQTNTSISVGLSFSLKDKDNSYFVGFGTSDEDEEKATLIYHVLDEDGKDHKRMKEINRLNKNDYFDGLGDIGSNTFTTYCDIACNPGEKFNTKQKSYLINVFKAVVNEEGKFIPEREGGKLVHRYIECSASKTLKSNTFTIDQFVEFKYLGATKYFNYSCFDFECLSHGEEIYPTIKDKIYTQNKEFIDNGAYWIRTSLVFSSDSVIRFTYKNKDTIVKTAKSYSPNITGENAKLELIYKDVPIDDISEVEIHNYSVKVDIFSTSTNKAVPKSNVNYRFAYTKLGVSNIQTKQGTVLYEANTNSTVTNASLIWLISVISFAVVYVIVSIILYFYLKEKNKEDIFKRMRTKQYWQTNILGLVCLLSLITAIESIYFRLTGLRNTFAVFNPIDIPICITCVISIILGGFFIKYFYTAIKNKIIKRKEEKLKLNTSVIDDGTLIMPKTEK